MMNRRLLLVLAVVWLLVWGQGIPATAQAVGDNSTVYYNIVNENGEVVYITGWGIQVGDQFLTDQNKRYEIESIAGNQAKARFIGDVNIAQYLPEKEQQSWLAKALQFRRVHAEDPGKVAIYHTHSDESYVPTDGTDSIYGNGGIYKVGDSFASALKAEGMEVVHSDARHDPHDDMAYERSRRTVANLIKQQQPDAVFDVHRDSTPPEVYKATVNGEDVTKLQLVVGKYGPTGKQIEDYALQIKANADQKHPGLIKGIFFAKGGDYNQDLHPRSMLLEVGAHTNDRASAERGIALFADIVPAILNKTGANPANQAGQAGVGTAAAGPSGASKSIGWIVGLVVVGAAAFLFLSTGSMREAKSKLKQFTGTEFANFLAPYRKNKQKYRDKDRENKE